MAGTILAYQSRWVEDLKLSPQEVLVGAYNRKSGSNHLSNGLFPIDGCLCVFIRSGANPQPEQAYSRYRHGQPYVKAG